MKCPAGHAVQPLTVNGAPSLTPEGFQIYFCPCLKGGVWTETRLILALQQKAKQEHEERIKNQKTTKRKKQKTESLF